MGYGMGPAMGWGPQFGPMTGFGFAPNLTPARGWGGGFGFTPPANAWMGPAALGWGLGGSRVWGGTYTPQFLTTGLPTDPEIVEMVYDSLDTDPLVPYAADITVDSDAGVVTLRGTVHSKQVKHAAGDDAWWIPGVDDVRNELQVVSERRAGRAATGRAPRAVPTTAPSGRTRRARTAPTGRAR